MSLHGSRKGKDSLKKPHEKEPEKKPRVMVLGAGSYAHSTLGTLRASGIEGITCLTREIGRYPASLVGEIINPGELADYLDNHSIDLVVPMSVDWQKLAGTRAVIDKHIPVFGPPPEGLRLERDRQFASDLCRQFSIPVPKSRVASNRLEAERILAEDNQLLVIKNPLCSPTSPIQAIVCETLSETKAWLGAIDYAEGVFLQEFMGRKEAGHVAFISDGTLIPMVTNQEYKRCYNGNLGTVAGAPLGGIIEVDTGDKYGLVKELLEPLLPWFREVNYHGPVQVTAAMKNGKWHVLEYNARIGVTSGPLIMRVLENPLECCINVARNKQVSPRFKPGHHFGCSISLTGYGFPYQDVKCPSLPITIEGEIDCDLWWNQVRKAEDGDHLITLGQRLADINTTGADLESAVAHGYRNIRKLQCGGSYYRTDIGQCLWPPGNE